MGKIGLIIAREYLSRVKKKSFIVMTLLGPLLFAGIVIVPVWLASSDSATEQKVVKVIDESGFFKGKFKSTSSLLIEYSEESIIAAKEQLQQNKGQIILFIPPLELDQKAEVSLYAFNSPGFGLISDLRGMLRKELEKIKLVNSGIDARELEKLKAHVEINTFNLSNAGKVNESSSEAAMAVGYIAAFLIYFFIFMYGAQIMRGVIEEKTSRVIEVIISSVKPFQLMMGKIIGVGAVGFTQFLLWVSLSFGIITAGSALLFGDIEPEKMETMMKEQAFQPTPQQQAGMEVFDALDKINFPLVVGCFVFFFLAGYLLYGSLFAAVGSAVGSDADSQQFMLPITVPLIFSIVLISAILKDPHGPLAVWASIIPLTSPVVMMMRIPFDVPGWQIALSMLMVVLGFLGTTWVAGRIYRIGIFMHGTKVSYKVLAKWFTMKI